MPLFNDQKVSRWSRDRRPYYAPTDNGVLCPNALVNVNNIPIVKPDSVTLGKCVCTADNPFCSYYLEDDKTDGGEHVCRRYVPWRSDDDKPVDTHQRRVNIQDGNLNWYP